MDRLAYDAPLQVAFAFEIRHISFPIGETNTTSVIRLEFVGCIISLMLMTIQCPLPDQEQPKSLQMREGSYRLPRLVLNATPMLMRQVLACLISCSASKDLLRRLNALLTSHLSDVVELEQ